MKSFRLIALLSISLITLVCAAQASEIDAQFFEKKFPIELDGKPCQLTRVGMQVFKEETFSDGKRDGNISIMAGFYETNRPNCMETYGFVQWIKGCYTSNRFNVKTGEFSEYLAGRDLRGKSVPFVHSDWEVDTVDTDPLYGSSVDTLIENPELKRHSFHYVFAKPLGRSNLRDDLLFDQDVMNHLGSGKDMVYRQTPESPQAKANQWVIRDIPSSGSVLWDRNHPDVYSASDSYLEFKLCIYRIENIPLTGSPARFDAAPHQGGPVHCFDWDVKNGFSRESLQMEPIVVPPAVCKMKP